MTSLCAEVVEAVLTVVNNLRAIERHMSYNVVSNIRAEEWYRSSKGEPAHDGGCLVLYLFRYPGLLAYRESDEGRAECSEMVGQLGSWKSQETVLKETERFKYFINADLMLPDSDKLRPGMGHSFVPLETMPTETQEPAQGRECNREREGIGQIPHEADLPARTALRSDHGPNEVVHSLQGLVVSKETNLATLGKSYNAKFFQPFFDAMHFRSESATH